MLGKIEGRRRKGHQRMRCFNDIPDSMDMSLSKLQELVMPSNHSSSVAPFSSCPQSFSESGSFPVSWLFTSCGQSIGVSASASVLSMNIQGLFSLGLTGLISLLSKGLSRAFSSTIRKHQFFSAQPFYSPTLTSVHDYW